MEQAEQLKRQLQRLSRERSSPQLNEASSQIEKAIEEMKKALNGSQQGNGAEASAQGMRALQQLNDAARKLARQQQAGLSQELDQAVTESRKLVDEQKRIQEGIDGCQGQAAVGRCGRGQTTPGGNGCPQNNACGPGEKSRRSDPGSVQTGAEDSKGGE